MRAWWTLLLVATIAVAVRAQEGGGPPPGTPPAFTQWKLPEKDARKLEELLAAYLGSAKDRVEALKRIEKFLEKPVDGHSPLEDVGAAKMSTMFGAPAGGAPRPKALPGSKAVPAAARGTAVSGNRAG